jgi:hypothetical protein
MKTDSTWSPFQSPEVQEICSHLTPAEHQKLIDDARTRGTELGKWLALPLMLAIISFTFSWRLGTVLVVLYALYVLFVVLPRLRAMRRRSKELLCDTEWARSHGYAPDTLRLVVFPWSRPK